MKKVMVFGSFDVLHPGHIHFLNDAKEFGDYLIVVLAREKTIMEVKGKKPKYGESDRLAHLRELKIADNVVLGNAGDKYGIIQQFMPDFICLGYDQQVFTEKLKDELEKRKIKSDIIRLRPYREDIYKSSKLK